MKRFTMYIFVFVLLLSLISCENDAELESQPNSVYAQSLLLEDALAQESTLDVELSWADFPEYTENIPSPDFISGVPLRVKVASEVVLTFSSAADTDAETLRRYLSKLQSVGFECVTEYEADDVFYGKVFKDGRIVMEFTFRYGLIMLDVFKNT